MTRALVVVDLQRDFCEGGALPVTGGNQVARLITDAIRQFVGGYSPYYDFFVATKDWHLPADSNGGHISANPDYVTTWPEHCIQGTEGAMFHEYFGDLAFTAIDAVFYKGQGRADYSGFQGKTPTLHGDVYLQEWLQARGVTDIDVVGLATDHCVRATALDGIQLGYNVRTPAHLTAAVGGEEAKIKTIELVRAAQGLDAGLIN